MRDKKGLLNIFFVSLYIYFFLGLIFHTSLKHEVFGKYSLKYAGVLCILFIAFPFLLLLFNYYIKLSKITISKKRIKLTSFRKFIFAIVFLILVYGVFRPFVIKIGIKEDPNRPYSLGMKNFHPFLQSKLLPENNIGNKGLHVNSEGFRYDELKKEKLKDEYRIFVMGGSTVENASFSYEDTFVRIVEEKLRKRYPKVHIKVINAGNSAYTSEHSLIQYLFHVREFHPDMIIIWQGINDMYYSCETIATLGPYKDDYSHYMGLAWPLVRSYYDPKPFFSIHAKDFDIAFDVFNFIFYSDLRNFVKDRKDSAQKPKFVTKNNFPSIDSFERNMTYFTKIALMDGSQVILANQPYLYRSDLPNTTNWFVGSACSQKNQTYPDNRSLINGIEKFNEVSRKIANQQSVPFLDLSSQIPKTNKYFVDDVHFTKEGNKKVANVIYEYLINSSLLQY